MLREMGVRMWARDGSTLGSVASAASAASSGEDVVVADRPVAEPVRARAPSRPSPSTQQRPQAEIEWLPADWLIVGEPFDAGAGVGVGAGAAVVAAGEQERLLFNMLQAVRVSRDAPARAARACHFALGEGTGQRLEAALDGVRPRLILALGRIAAEALLGVDEPLGRLRGKVHERAGTHVVVSFPLAYLLRNPAEKAKAWADLCLAVASLETGAG
ncbi:MAG: hypothetical protein M3Y55_02960 [Pseudomonadota bacterium]|nr:hypothetical protein [Pseudomonadota bacterium]